VLLQGYSTLDEHHPGDPAVLIDYAGRLAHLFRRRSRVDIRWYLRGHALTKRIFEGIGTANDRRDG